MLFTVWPQSQLWQFFWSQWVYAPGRNLALNIWISVELLEFPCIFSPSILYWILIIVKDASLPAMETNFLFLSPDQMERRVAAGLPSPHTYCPGPEGTTFKGTLVVHSVVHLPPETPWRMGAFCDLQTSFQGTKQRLLCIWTFNALRSKEKWH